MPISFYNSSSVRPRDFFKSSNLQVCHERFVALSYSLPPALAHILNFNIVNASISGITEISDFRANFLIYGYTGNGSKMFYDIYVLSNRIVSGQQSTTQKIITKSNGMKSRG